MPDKLTADEQAAADAAVEAHRAGIQRDKESAKRHEAELKLQQDVRDAVHEANTKELPKLGGSPL